MTYLTNQIFKKGRKILPFLKAFLHFFKMKFCYNLEKNAMTRNHDNNQESMLLKESINYSTEVQTIHINRNIKIERSYSKI